MSTRADAYVSSQMAPASRVPYTHRLRCAQRLSAMPNSLWTQPKGDKTIRKMLKDAVQRPRTAPLLSRGGVAFETPLLREAPRMGSFRVGPAHDKGGVSPWNPVVARGAAAPKLGKRCVLAPGGARNTFRFPPGLATGNDGETQLCCFKSCVGAKLARVSERWVCLGRHWALDHTLDHATLGT